MSEYADVPVDTCLCVRVDTEGWLKRDTQTHTGRDRSATQQQDPTIDGKSFLVVAGKWKAWLVIDQ